MPLEDLTRIDIIATSKVGKTTLVITDAGVTTDPQERNDLFMQKLGLYVSMITGDDLKDDFPNHSPWDFEIQVVCANEPTPEMLAISSVKPKGAGMDQAIQVNFEIMGLGDAKSKQIVRPELVVPELSEDLKNAIELVFSMGLDQIKSRSFMAFGAALTEGGISVVMLTGENPKEMAQKYVSGLTEEVKAIAFGFDGFLGQIGGGKMDALLVEACELGQEKGVVFGQRYQPKKFLKKFALVGEREYLGETDNILNDENPAQ